MLGGEDDNDHLRTAECYDPETDTWESIAPMSINRTGLGAFALGAFVYAAGGYNENEYLDSVERYDRVTNRFLNLYSYD